jgi:hypothetical protein
VCKAAGLVFVRRSYRPSAQCGHGGWQRGVAQDAHHAHGVQYLQVRQSYDGQVTKRTNERRPRATGTTAVQYNKMQPPPTGLFTRWPISTANCARLRGRVPGGGGRRSTKHNSRMPSCGR